MMRVPCLSVLVALCLCATTWAATPTERAEMRRLLEQRDGLARQLEELDQLAAVRVLDGERPLDLYARQIEVERRLDTLVNRIEMLAARTHQSVPELGTAHELSDEQRARTVERASALLERGRERALAVVRQETEAFLAELDFTEFLSDE
ncbi:hypothetical protein [Mucisphaera calidilacus]|uniref:Uncharacterized protein n=1 Tax=Mucisphaera calidilacus TaxID=2527982 RepID=A0A518BVC8_9BACT|nr:hypothetical protein [Mucisphaera calidilacus]QDU70935.1 hypothetical protein Pan265_07790 [Mucisphaera calidilacus]